jgi:hypothetical protein
MATKSTASGAPKSEPGVIDIRLTSEQCEQIKRQSKGKIDVTFFRLRPEMNLRLQDLTRVIDAKLRPAQSIANGGGVYWV